MWVQPSLGVLSFIWENGEDTLCFLHPFQNGRKSKRNVCRRGEESPPMRWPIRQILEEHLLTEGNTVWTSGNRRLRCVSSILLGFLLCLTVRSLQSFAWSSAGKNTPLSVFSDMKRALGFIGIFLSFLVGECVVSLPQLKMPASVLHMRRKSQATQVTALRFAWMCVWWTDLDAPDKAHLKKVHVDQLILMNEWMNQDFYLTQKSSFFLFLDATYGQSTMSFGGWYNRLILFDFSLLTFPRYFDTILLFLSLIQIVGISLIVWTFAVFTMTFFMAEKWIAFITCLTITASSILSKRWNQSTALTDAYGVTWVGK